MTNLVGVCRENHGDLRDKEVGVATVGPEVLCMASRADRFWGFPRSGASNEPGEGAEWSREQAP